MNQDFKQHKSDLAGQSLIRRLEQENDHQFRKQLQLAQAISDRVKEEGGKALVVGGFARDEALRALGEKVRSKDIDLEIFGIEPDKLKNLLAGFGEVDEVGKSFGIFMVEGVEVAIPRKDTKAGPGHKGIQAETDPHLDFKSASSRRDFTINALALDPDTGDIFDAHEGITDLKNKIIRAVDEGSFAEDPLRVLRAGQLAGRFGFEIDKKTVEQARGAELTELSSDRVGQEWKKLLLRSEKPSIGLEYMKQMEVLKKLHPELEALVDTNQEPEWHPEGTVWEHTKLCMDVAADLVRKNDLSDENSLVVLLAVLCHDLGKPEKTEVNEKTGRIRSHGHAEAGVPLAEKFMRDIHISDKIIKKVLPLVRHHGIHRKKDITDKQVKNLAVKLHPGTIEQMVLVGEADKQGRAEKSSPWKKGKEILSRAKKMEIERSKPEPLVTGEDLLELGYKEGPELGEVLDKVYKAQLDGKIETKEEGIKIAAEDVSARGGRASSKCKM